MSALNFNVTCPVPLTQYPHVLLAHGGGGRMMHQLISRMFLAAFSNPLLDTHHDAAVVELPGRRMAFTTDSYVVRPLFFPGGDIGSMAVHGTVNDLAMAGARPLYLSSAFILEEGLPMETLWRVVCSMRDAAWRCGVQIITGDTKVVDRGKGDGVFINTAGVGVVEHPRVIAPGAVRAGDVILVNGDVGRHGMAIMAVREGLAFDSQIESDSAPVHETVQALLAAGIEIHCLRDLTRGGLTSALHEIAEVARLTVQVEETLIPVREVVHAACEILGLDPFQSACEGRFAVFVTPADAGRALEIMQAHNPEASRIGQATQEGGAGVFLKSALGTRRILDLASGEQLPRIC